MTRWPTKPLGEVLEVSRERIQPLEHPNTSFNYVGLDSVEGHTGRLLPYQLTPGAEIKSTKNVFHPGQILFGKLRPYLNKVHLTREKGICSTDIYVLNPCQHLVDAAFASYFLRSPVVLAAVSNAMAGANLPRINEESLLEISTPVPPLAEQERIVKLLDEADELRKLRTQADRRTADLIPALFCEMFGENAKKPHVRVKLEQIAEVVSGVAKGRKFNGRLPVEVPYLRVANVQAGHLDLSEIKTIQALPEEVEELALRKGDVLLTEGGDFDKLGRGAMLEQDLPNCIHQNHVFRVRVEQSKLDPVYFAKFLLTGEARRYFLGCAKRTTNLASINMTQLRALPVLLPPLPLQKEFAARVSDIRAMQAEQAASRRRLDDLFHSMLHRAFQGEL
jgi:type I restriction enzyme S subunit